jgi:hypothetical protein
MDPAGWTRLARVLGVVWLITLVLGNFVGLLGPVPVAVGLGLIAAYWLVQREWPGLRRRLRAARPRDLLTGVVASPADRYTDRAPVSLIALARQVEDAALGQVTVEGAVLRVSDRSGEFVELRVPDPRAVVRSGIALTATSVELAALCSDAIATRVGPIQLRIGGLDLFIDGTVPRFQLERTIHDAKIARARQLRIELETAGERGPLN